MKENLRVDIYKSCNKIDNIKKQVLEINKKLENLQVHLKNLENSLQEEEKHLYLLGLKQHRRDGLAETPKELEAKAAYNAKLQQEKKELISQEYGENTPLDIELTKTNLFESKTVSW